MAKEIGISDISVEYSRLQRMVVLFGLRSAEVSEIMQRGKDSLGEEFQVSVEELGEAQNA